MPCYGQRTNTASAKYYRAHKCIGCNRRWTKQICDYPLRDFTGRTCCRAICDKCALKIEHMNFCPTHAPMVAKP